MYARKRMKHAEKDAPDYVLNLIFIKQEVNTTLAHVQCSYKSVMS